MYNRLIIRPKVKLQTKLYQIRENAVKISGRIAYDVLLMLVFVMLISVFLLPAVLLYINERIAYQRVESRIKFFLGAISGILYCFLFKTVFSGKMIFSTNVPVVIAVSAVLLFIIPGILAPLIDTYIIKPRSDVLNSHFHIAYLIGIYSIITPCLALVAFTSVSLWVSAGFPVLVISFVLFLDFILRKHSDSFFSPGFSREKACLLACIVGLAVYSGFVVTLWLLAFSAVFVWLATISLAVLVAILRFFYR